MPLKQSSVEYLLAKLINCVKRNMHGLHVELEQQVRELEQVFINDPTDATRGSWLSAQDALDRVVSSSADKERFFPN